MTSPCCAYDLIRRVRRSARAGLGFIVIEGLAWAAILAGGAMCALAI